jgi:phage shock protein A
MRSNVNALLDKCEDPAKMVDQTLLDLRRNLADVKKETASVMAVEKNARRLVDECRGKIQKYESAAKNALRAGCEEDARTLLSKKQEFEGQLPDLEANLQAAAKNADQLKQMHDKLVQDIESLEGRKAAVKAKVSTAKAQQTVNKAMAGMNSAASVSAFERMEAKANRMLDEAAAEAELNADTGSTEDLAKKYASASASVDDELARMKQELGVN